MTVFYSVIREAFLGYAAVFFCIGFAFLFLRSATGGQKGPAMWGTGFLLNSAGFLLWSGVVPLKTVLFYFFGEVFHIAGFILLVYGAYIFTGRRIGRRTVLLFAAWLAVWAAGVVLFGRYPYAAGIALKFVRAILFWWAAVMILRCPSCPTRGRRLAGWSLVGWGIYVSAMAFVKLPLPLHLMFGFLAGFQVMSALGLVVMAVDRMRLRAEESETRAERLEGLLPICSYCKKIRDDKDVWHSLESYISARSDTQFSHSICPECGRTHYPDVFEPKK